MVRFPLHIAVLLIVAKEQTMEFLRLALPVIVRKWWKYAPLSIVAVAAIPLSPIPGIPFLFLETLRQDIRNEKKGAS